jgi:hypothetical protein
MTVFAPRSVDIRNVRPASPTRIKVRRRNVSEN